MRDGRVSKRKSRSGLLQIGFFIQPRPRDGFDDSLRLFPADEPRSPQKQFDGIVGVETVDGFGPGHARSNQYRAMRRRGAENRRRFGPVRSNWSTNQPHFSCEVPRERMCSTRCARSMARSSQPQYSRSTSRSCPSAHRRLARLGSPREKTIESLLKEHHRHLPLSTLRLNLDTPPDPDESPQSTEQGRLPPRRFPRCHTSG